MSRLTDFYRGLATDHRGRTLTDLWAFSDDQIEEIHDFIQWMFPLREPSRFNRQAPLATQADLEEFRIDEALRASLRRSFERYLAFLGLTLESGQVVQAANFEAKRAILHEPNHNWLRITRVLASTRMLGLETESRAFFDFLNARFPEGSGIDPTTFDYWKHAATGE